MKFKKKIIFVCIDEYVREKPHRTKVKKRSKKRPKSASVTTEIESVKMNILILVFFLLIVFFIAKSCLT